MLSRLWDEADPVRAASALAFTPEWDDPRSMAALWRSQSESADVGERAGPGPAMWARQTFVS